MASILYVYFYNFVNIKCDNIRKQFGRTGGDRQYLFMQIPDRTVWRILSFVHVRSNYVRGNGTKIVSHAVHGLPSSQV